MVRNKIIKLAIFVLIYSVGLGCNVHVEPQQTIFDVKSQDEAIEALVRYLKLRLGNAHWNDYSKFITWPDEPSWDCKWVVSKYSLGPPERKKEKIVIPVKYIRIGLYCYDFKFEHDLQVVTINYDLIKGPNHWMVDGPAIDYPEINVNVLIKSLTAKAKNVNETPERRLKAEITVREITNAISE